jgi:iron-sulfur cluster insertion protein
MMNVTDTAATELKRIVDENGQPDLAVRVFVEGACGCGSARYGMGLEDDVAEGEQVLETCGIRFVVDPDSAQYLEGAEIDFRDSLMGRGFTIKGATQGGGGGCGCGH